MAPKKGGSSSSSSGSGSSGKKGGGGSSCPGCTAPLLLSGYDWKDSKTDALFAIQIITIVVLFACLVLATRFKWVRQAGGTDKLRHAGYSAAVAFALLFFILYVTTTALAESVTRTTYLFYITVIFRNLGWRVSEILSLAITLRTIAESVVSGAFAKFNLLPVLILALLSTTSYGMYVYETSQRIRYGDRFRYYSYSNDDNIEFARIRIDLSYQVIFFVASIYVVIASVYALLRARSKAMLVMVAAVASSLFIRTLFLLIDYAVYFNRTRVSFEVQKNIVWADNFVYTFTAMGIFGGLALIGIMRPSGNVVSKQQTEVTYG